MGEFGIMLALIPARGGSKSIPRKNIKDLCGKPLIFYTIDAAKEAKSIDHIILSTDDEKVVSVCKEYDCDIDVPFMRPPELATDGALAIDNYIYTIERLNKEFKYKYQEFVVLQPTSPLRNAMDIDNAIQIYLEKDADSVISVSEAIYPPLWAKKIDKNGVLKNYFNIENINKNRQELEKTYVPNGAVFVFRFSLLKERYSYYSEKTYPYIMPKERSIDIDNYIDFKFAEFMMVTK